MPNKEEKRSTIKKIFSDYKGILAADESTSTAGKRLSSINVESTPETRQKYREVFLTTPGIEKYLGGVIFYDETFRQKIEGKTFSEYVGEKGIVPGIKVDAGAKDSDKFPGEKVTEGLDGLSVRLADYYSLGARFAKWRAVITIGENLPTEGCLRKNAEIIAQYSKDCLDAGIVPIIEPEVLLEGTHTIEKSEEVITKTLEITFEAIKNIGLPLDEIILKTSMVVPGNKSGELMNPKEIAERTARCLKTSVPENLGGVVFLSGGQTSIQATENLNSIVKLGPYPWPLSFSYARALQGDALQIWQGKDENIPAAQEVFLKRLKLTYAANRGKYAGE